MIMIMLNSMSTERAALSFYVQCESKQNPPCLFQTFSPNGWEFLINFYTPIMHSYLR